MKETGILFKPDMIKAILEGRKTMTRRVLTKNNSTCGSLLTGDGQGWHSFDFNDVVVDGKQGNRWYLKVAVPENDTRHRIFSKHAIGDLLYIKEGFKPKQFAGVRLDGYDYKQDHIEWLTKNGQKYTPDSGCEMQVGKGYIEHWKSPLFMPKTAARIWLEITEIRVERLQEITEQDAQLEGAICCVKNYHVVKQYDDVFPSARQHFHELWQSINGKESWKTNPWVWVISFKKK